MAVIATYSLKHKIANFDFFNWLIMVQAEGAEKIIFDMTEIKCSNFGYTRESAIQRFYSIVEPGPALAGLPFRHGKEQGLDVPQFASRMVPWWQSDKGLRMKRLVSPKPAKICDYTVTLRHNREDKNVGSESRDSNRDAWRTFAQEIGAVLVEDWFDKPIHLHDRMALYAGAKMNFGVCNGPMFLLTLTEYPVCKWVNTDRAGRTQIKLGIKPGENYPWMRPNQSLVWQEDSLDNLRREFDRMQDGNLC